MSFDLTALTQLLVSEFDEVIDVRSPAEFAIDHVPGAINLPALDNEQRAEVGTIYVQDSRFTARKIGAAHVARNVATHIEQHFSDKDGSYRPLIYCWRGGQRSGSFSTILSQIGWRSETLTGGYRAYRRLVSDALYSNVFPAPLIVLAGNTGTAKTEILLRLKTRGHQVIDLEGLANHRGSLFGARVGGQPAQKAFESALAMEICQLDPARPVLVEAESSKVGACIVPPCLWKAMHVAPQIQLQAPLDARARYLTTAYRDLTDDRDRLADVINKLRPLHAGEVIERWLELASKNALEQLAGELMSEHYDPRYSKGREASGTKPSCVLEIADLSADGLGTACIEIEAAVAELTASTSKQP